MSAEPTAISPERWFAIVMSIVLLGSPEHLRGQQTSLTTVDATGFEREDGWCPGFACGPAFDGCFDPAGDASMNCGVENPNEATGWNGTAAVFWAVGEIGYRLVRRAMARDARDLFAWPAVLSSASRRASARFDSTCGGSPPWL